MLILAIVYDKQYRLRIKSYSRTKQPDIKPVIAILLASVFIVTEGLRYGRGVDQLGNYGPFYLQCLSPKLYFQEMESLFVWLNQIVYHLDFTIGILPFGLIFVVYAIIFWICLWVLYKDYKNITKYFLFFAILATNYVTEWTIRQGVSLSFALPAIYYLDNKKYKWCIVFLLLSIFTHYGNALSITLLLFCYFFLNKKPLPIKLTIPLYFILSFSFTSLLPYINDKISSLNLSFLGGNFQGYINNSSSSFGSEAVNEEWERGTIQQILTTSFYCGIIIIGYYFHKLFNEKVYIYNTYVFGILVVEPFHQIGNLTRIFLLASVLWFIPISLALYKWNLIKTRKIVQISGFLVFIYLLLYYGRYIFLNPSATYVWNI